MTDDEIYREALDRFGEGVQAGMAMTEAGELIAALGRHYIQQRENAEGVIDELADVSIMLDQMSIVFGTEKVASRKAEKLARFAGILSGDVPHPHTGEIKRQNAFDNKEVFE